LRLNTILTCIGIRPEILAFQQKWPLDNRQFGIELIRSIGEKVARICQTHIGEKGIEGCVDLINRNRSTLNL
jgi:hypothetical protein